MLLLQQLALDGLDGVRHNLDHALLEVGEELRAALPVGLRLFGHLHHERLYRADISLLELSVILTVLLDGVVRQLHEDLVLIWQSRVVPLVLF